MNWSSWLSSKNKCFVFSCFFPRLLSVAHISTLMTVFAPLFVGGFNPSPNKWDHHGRIRSNIGQIILPGHPVLHPVPGFSSCDPQSHVTSCHISFNSRSSGRRKSLKNLLSAGITSVFNAAPADWRHTEQPAQGLRFTSWVGRVEVVGVDGSLKFFDVLPSTSLGWAIKKAWIMVIHPTTKSLRSQWPGSGP